MSVSMSQQLQDLCKFEEAERNFKLSSSPSIRFIPQVLGDEDMGETMTLDLRLTPDTSTQVTFKDTKAGEEKDETRTDVAKPPAKAVEKPNTYKQKFRKLCHGSAEDFLKWARSLQAVFKGKPCTSPESKFEMTGLMLYGNLKDTWEAIQAEHIGVIVKRTFNKGTPEECKKEVPRGFTLGGHKECLKQLSHHFFSEFAARKQKTYMRSNLLKPEKVPVKMMTARLKVMNSYLPSFPSPENTSFSTGEMIDIILSMVPKHWIEMMITAKIEPRSMTVKELVDHLENLELQDEAGTASIPKKKKEFKSSARKSSYGRNSTTEKGCDLCKLFKGVDSPAWKTHTTEQCRSARYYGEKLQKKLIIKVVIKEPIRASILTIVLAKEISRTLKPI